MQLLLDTHVLLWSLAGDERLGERAADIIEDGRNVVYVSAASIWEISIKRSIGKLRLPGDVLAEVDAASFTRLAISFEHADAVASLPDLHADPFDRMLIAQASTDRLVLMTHDPLVLQYGVDTFEVGVSTLWVASEYSTCSVDALPSGSRTSSASNGSLGCSDIHPG